MCDQLTEINRDDLPKLRDLYSPDTRRSYNAYVALDTYIKWLERDSNVTHLKIYCLNGDYSHGSFVSIVKVSVYFTFDYD